MGMKPLENSEQNSVFELKAPSNNKEVLVNNNKFDWKQSGRNFGQGIKKLFHNKDLANNCNFYWMQAGRNFGKGMKKPFKEVVNYAKEHPVQAALIGAGAVGLTIAAGSSSIVATGLIALGVYFVGNPLIKGTAKMIKAKNGDDKEKACIDFGESFTYLGLTFTPKIIPKPKSISKVINVLHKTNIANISLWSNATDIASLGPKVGNLGTKAGRTTMLFSRATNK